MKPGIGTMNLADALKLDDPRCAETERLDFEQQSGLYGETSMPDVPCHT